MKNEKLLSIIDKFKDQSILVVGDVMLDKYIYGKVSRISPEAPVQILETTKESSIPGGASNVATNCAEFCKRVYLLGVAGNDQSRKELIKKLESKVIIKEIIEDETRPTTQKTRVMGGTHQLLRIDEEKTHPISKHIQNKIISNIQNKINKVQIVIISDYAKGVVSRELVEQITKICKENKILLIADPKPRNFSNYKNITLLTPNHLEALQMSNSNKIQKAGEVLVKKLESNVLITRGSEGMSLFEVGGNKKTIPTMAREVFDVTGAGDTVIATIAMSLASGATLEESALLANYAAGIKVRKIGTSTVKLAELKEELKIRAEHRPRSVRLRNRTVCANI